MVIAAALISLAVLDPAAEPQSPPPPDPKPYTVEGVRRAMASGARSSPTVPMVEPGPRFHQMTVESTSHGSCALIACQSSRRSRWEDVSSPTWHDQFLAMTGPQGYAIPFSGMSNSQRIAAVGSSVAIGFALKGVTSFMEGKIAKIRADRKQKKLDKVRAEIRAELAELERLNAAARASGQMAVR